MAHTGPPHASTNLRHEHLVTELSQVVLHTYPERMAMYRVVRVKTASCPANERARHIVEAEIEGSEETRQADVSVLRLMLSSGDDVYTTSPTSGDRADITKGRCACGFKTIRSVRRDVTDNDVTSSPSYT